MTEYDFTGARFKMAASSGKFAVSRRDEAGEQGLPLSPPVSPRDLPDTGLSRRTPFQSFDKEQEPGPLFGRLDVLASVTAIIFYYIDVGSDVYLTVSYVVARKWVWFGLTLAFVVGPLLVVCIVNLRLYYIDYKNQVKTQKERGPETLQRNVTTQMWAVRVVLTLLQMGPVIRHIEYIYCGIKSKSDKKSDDQQKLYYKLMRYEDVDVCMLRLFECFLEAAPQLALQIYIWVLEKPDEDIVFGGIRAIALLTSWLGMSWSLVSYHRSLRFSRDDKKNMTWPGSIVYFLWRACEIGPRVMVLALFATRFSYWVFAVILIHWLFNLLWLICQHTKFCPNRCEEYLFNAVCAYVLLFCYLNIKEGQSRYRYLIFYFIFYLENILVGIIWYTLASVQDLGAWYHMAGLITFLSGLVLHPALQLTYYRFFHPTQNIKACLCNSKDVNRSICYDHDSDNDTEERERTGRLVKATNLENGSSV